MVGFKAIAQAKCTIFRVQGLWKTVFGNMLRFMPHQFITGQEQDVRVALLSVFAPVLKAGCIDHPGADALLIEGKQHGLVDQHILPA